ncbi:hypothetical protein [Actinomadura sp. WMMA1423]|uniref:DUF6893 family small protein n=1 Tax=Actinomadura sp. WMMA1423 TaxID=2591108 RepID=UPI00143E0E09|nr:hypothetical protein [Actinomadura sp. WMMA1423]
MRKCMGRRVELKRGIFIGAGVIRLMLAVLAVGALVLFVKEFPGLRRYLKTESM